MTDEVRHEVVVSEQQRVRQMLDAPNVLTGSTKVERAIAMSIESQDYLRTLGIIVKAAEAPEKMQ